MRSRSWPLIVVCLLAGPARAGVVAPELDPSGFAGGVSLATAIVLLLVDRRPRRRPDGGADR
jgi:hypothetical protein